MDYLFSSASAAAGAWFDPCAFGVLTRSSSTLSLALSINASTSSSSSSPPASAAATASCTRSPSTATLASLGVIISASSSSTASKQQLPSVITAASSPSRSLITNDDDDESSIAGSSVSSHADSAISGLSATSFNHRTNTNKRLKPDVDSTASASSKVAFLTGHAKFMPASIESEDDEDEDDEDGEDGSASTSDVSDSNDDNDSGKDDEEEEENCDDEEEDDGLIAIAQELRKMGHPLPSPQQQHISMEEDDSYHSPPNSLESSPSNSKDSLISTASASRSSSPHRKHRHHSHDSDDSSVVASNSLYRLSASLYREAGFLLGLGMHQVGTVTSGILGLVTKGSARPTWPAHLHMTLHFLRAQLNFKGLNMARARKAEAAIDVNLAPPGCRVTTIQMHVARQSLLKFEAESLRFAGKFTYPIPPEIDEHGEQVLYRDYKLDGEWVEAVEKPKTTSATHKWFGSWFWGSPSDDASTVADGEFEGGVRRGPRKKVILFCHGGAYVVGNPILYRHLTGRIAAQTGCRVFVINYRLAPEAPFPAALHDVFAAYLYLINPHHPSFESTDPTNPQPRCDIVHEPVRPEDVILMGDSAGGGIAFSLLNYLKDFLRWPNGSPMLPLPGGAILLSPWVDLTFSSQSWRDNAEFDWLPSNARNIHEPIIPATADQSGIPHPVHMYLFGTNPKRSIPLPTADRRTSISSPGGVYGRTWREALLMSAADREASRIRDVTERMVRHPLVSPVFSEDMSGLPPILIQTGDAEVLRDENFALAYRYHIANDPKHRRPHPQQSRMGLSSGGTQQQQQQQRRHNAPPSFVRLESYVAMVHVWIALAWLKESQLAMKNLVGFIDELERISDAQQNRVVADWADGLDTSSNSSSCGMGGGCPTRGHPPEMVFSEEERRMMDINPHLRML